LNVSYYVITKNYGAIGGIIMGCTNQNRILIPICDILKQTSINSAIHLGLGLHEDKASVITIGAEKIAECAVNKEDGRGSIEKKHARY
jgi:hypothetical protein